MGCVGRFAWWGRAVGSARGVRRGLFHTMSEIPVPLPRVHVWETTTNLRMCN
jgi:hypothetical protein